MKAHNKKIKPKHTTKTVYRRRWIDAKWQCRSSFTINKYRKIKHLKLKLYSLIFSTNKW